VGVEYTERIQGMLPIRETRRRREEDRRSQTSGGSDYYSKGNINLASLL
jgi:hypothetical protein